MTIVFLKPLKGNDMGLDMYLNAKRYLWRTRGEEATLAQQISDLDIGNNGMRVKEITCEAMYWRKANAIHYWFVQNIQDGSDDCREYYVSQEKLQSLLETCETVVADPSKADELLPPAEGFFFGSNAIDEWYWDDLNDTIITMKRILESTTDEWEFYYASSW
jgi:hypothetical protein